MLGAALAGLALGLLVIFALAPGFRGRQVEAPSFEAQICLLPTKVLERIRRGYFPPRSGQISLLPKVPAYMSTAAGGWSHSGPWGYLQNVPLVFYGPGIVPSGVEVDRPVTLADVAPTLAALAGERFDTPDGEVLSEVVRPGAPRPRLIVTVVWDGGGDNTLALWPQAWPNLARLATEGVSYSRATVGSSPSVTPSVHSTLGTGVFPYRHGITGIPVRDENGRVVDSFLKGESSRFLRVQTFAEVYDEAHGNRALVGMLGYEPWHLGMIGQGAERLGGDRDQAVWLDTRTNEWKTNPLHYELPASLSGPDRLGPYLQQTDAADGQVDGAWRDQAILDDPTRYEETPGFVHFHTDEMLRMIAQEGYGSGGPTDLLFTNYKQIDRVGHYFNMASPYVRDVLRASDEDLRRLVEGLDRTVGKGRWVLVVTADHGQQPDAEAVEGYGINPSEVEADIRARFGDVVRAVWPTEVFLLEEAMAERGVSPADVARFLSGYTLAENASGIGSNFTGAGSFEPEDRLFELAVPAHLLTGVDCRRRPLRDRQTTQGDG